jgi:hypothetical protein
MGLLDDLVGLADQVTDSLGLKSTVTHESISSVSGSGNRSYLAPVARQAIVVKKQRLIKTASGEMVMSQAYIAFLNPTVVNVLDRITLADGTTGPILNTEGFVTAVNPILTEIYLG